MKRLSSLSPYDLLQVHTARRHHTWVCCQWTVSMNFWAKIVFLKSLKISCCKCSSRPLTSCRNWQRRAAPTPLAIGLRNWMKSELTWGISLSILCTWFLDVTSKSLNDLRWTIIVIAYSLYTFLAVCKDWFLHYMWRSCSFFSKCNFYYNL